MEEKNYVEVATVEKQGKNPKKKGIAILLCLFGGFVGAHKFYEGKYFMGVLYLLTVGFMGIGVLIDLIGLLRQPSVYYVKSNKSDVSFLEAIQRFRFDIIGYILSGVGGIFLLLLMHSKEVEGAFNFTYLLVGVILIALGSVLAFLKTRNLKRTILVNLGVALIAIVGTYVIAAAIVFVILWIALKFMLGIDLMEIVLSFFGKDENKEVVNDNSVWSVHTMPDKITGPYNNVYYRESIGVSSAEYVSKYGDRVVIHDHNIDIPGNVAKTNDGTFFW